jgi:hypothetical protein
MRVIAVSVGFVGLICEVACGGVLGDSKAAFEAGHYAEAKQSLVSLEGPSRTWPEAQRIEYALYRGLTYGALGDCGRASAWLREAKRLDDAHPGVLPSDDRQRLAAAVVTYEVP